jgi:hypothetical protein
MELTPLRGAAHRRAVGAERLDKRSTRLGQVKPAQESISGFGD